MDERLSQLRAKILKRIENDRAAAEIYCNSGRLSAVQSDARHRGYCHGRGLGIAENAKFLGEILADLDHLKK